MRIADARRLLDASRFQGAVYLAGYAIECHLKFAVYQRKQVIQLPAVLEVHDWDCLVFEAGLLDKIRDQPGIAQVYAALSEQWGPELRYRTKNFEHREGRRLYTDIEELYQFLRELVP